MCRCQYDLSEYGLPGDSLFIHAKSVGHCMNLDNIFIEGCFAL
jgi:hypothetical protein